VETPIWEARPQTWVVVIVELVAVAALVGLEVQII
jgi:hypothetical protein